MDSRFDVDRYIRENSLQYNTGIVSYESKRKVENDPTLTSQQKKEVLDELESRALRYY